MAPEASLGAYRVFGCTGSTTAGIMLQAMERAYQDGMHVLNMSIGASYQWPQYPIAKAASRLVKKGMVVTVSAGNSGTNGQYATGAPSLSENARTRSPSRTVISRICSRTSPTSHVACSSRS